VHKLKLIGKNRNLPCRGAQAEADRKRTGIYPEVHKLKLTGKEQEFTLRCTHKLKLIGKEQEFTLRCKNAKISEEKTEMLSCCVNRFVRGYGLIFFFMRASNNIDRRFFSLLVEKPFIDL
jgi:hypothetical protein